MRNNNQAFFARNLFHLPIWQVDTFFSLSGLSRGMIHSQTRQVWWILQCFVTTSTSNPTIPPLPPTPNPKKNRRSGTKHRTYKCAKENIFAFRVPVRKRLTLDSKIRSIKTGDATLTYAIAVNSCFVQFRLLANLVGGYLPLPVSSLYG